VGVLGSSCDPARAAAEAAAGIRAVVVDVGWDRYEPSPGAVDAAYVEDMSARIATCERAGLRVILGPGLQYPPAWVLDLPDGSYRDQRGDTPSPRVANLVFSAAVRAAAAAYLARLATDLDLSRFRAVRIGTTATGELGYPGPNPGGDGDAFWAYDAAGQTGVGLAGGAARSPMPGWVPGQATWDGAPVTADRAGAWWAWYRDALSEALAWQVATLRGLGFGGEIHVPVAGRGVRTDGLAAALRNRLVPADLPEGSLERALDYPTQFAALADLDRTDRAAGHGGILVDFTGLDDVSAVRARATAPALDSCHPNDVAALARADPAAAAWPAQRWTIAQAKRAGLAVVAENPGPPTAANTGGEPDSDPIATQMRNAPKAAAECGATLFLWAFEDVLFDRVSGLRPADLTR
jgi:hypothetical protein